MKLLEIDTPAMKKHKEQLLGSDTEVFTGDQYDLLSMLKNLGWSLRQWEAMTIHEQEKTRAHYQLDAMVQLIRRHDELVKENARRQQEKLDAKNKKGKK